MKSSRHDLKVCKLLEPAHFHDTGRGMRARKKLRADDTIVSIPGECLITVNTVLKSDIGVIIERENLRFSPQQLLTLFLLVEKRKAHLSAWWPYLATLPATYTTALYMEGHDLDLLPPCARAQAGESKARFESACLKMRSFLKTFYENSQPIENITDIRWAWSTVNTRSVYMLNQPHPCVNLEPSESHMALAPFLDMLNHSDSAQISAGLNPVTGSYDIITHTSYNKYDQVFISYGSHDNQKLLIDYGFTLHHNVNCSYVFSLDTLKTLIWRLCKTTGEWNRKLNIFHEAKLNGKMVCSREGCSWSLVNAMRMFCLSWDELKKSKRALIGETISEDNNSLASRLLQSLITDALKVAQARLNSLENSKEDQDSQFLGMIIMLAQDDVDILESSLALLPRR